MLQLWFILIFRQLRRGDFGLAKSLNRSCKTQDLNYTIWNLYFYTRDNFSEPHLYSLLCKLVVTCNCSHKRKVHTSQLILIINLLMWLLKPFTNFFKIQNLSSNFSPRSRKEKQQRIFLKETYCICIGFMNTAIYLLDSIHYYTPFGLFGCFLFLSAGIDRWVMHLSCVNYKILLMRMFPEKNVYWDAKIHHSSLIFSL